MDLLFALDPALETRRVPQTSEHVQHLWNAVVGEHSERVDVVEFAVGGAVEGGPEVGDEDLGAFVEADLLGVEGGGVVEGVDVLG